MFDWAAVGFWQRLRRGSHSSRRDSLSSPETSHLIRPDVCGDALEVYRSMLRFCLHLYVFTQIYSISLLFRVTLRIAVASLTSAGRIPRTNTPNNHFHINKYQRHTDSEGSELFFPLTVNGGCVFRPEVWTIEVDWTRLLFLKMAVRWVMLTGTLLSTIP